MGTRGTPKGEEFTMTTATTIDRNEAIITIRRNLKARSGKSWSVRGGAGTSWGWIDVCSPPSRLVDGVMTEADKKELAALLGLDMVHCQGEQIPAGHDYRVEYVARSAGLKPPVVGVPYWD
jgi:hypothetical protein